MIFTAAHLLAGAAALVIPLIIHLLNRSRHRKVRWGAMHLLSRVVRTNQRRLRIQQLILLILRCAFPAVLAFTLSGPVLTEFSFLPGDAPGRTVILVDNSYSLSAANPETASQTAFKAIRRALDEVLETQAEGTETVLIAVGGHPNLVEPAVLDRRRIRQRFETGIHPESDPVDVAAAFRLANEVLAESSRPRKTIVLISDFQAADWNAVSTELPDSPSHDSSNESNNSESRATVESLQDANTAVAFYRVGNSQDGNVAVESLQLPPVALAVGQHIEITATVRNFGPALSEVPAFLRVNGDRVAAAQVDLPATGTAEVTFVRHFDERGSHLVQIEVDVVDPLPFDNRQTAAIEVPERLPVLVVDSAADADVNFLKAALTPFELDGIGIEDLIRATFVTPEDFAPVQLLGSRAVILSNVEALTEPQLLGVHDFVQDGGGLVVFPGPKSNIAWFNEGLFPSVALTVSWQTILPPPEDEATILREQSDHPVFEIFNETDNGDPTTAAIQSWIDIRPGEESQPISRLTDHPFIVESTQHRGRVLIAATDAVGEWSNMPQHSFFVPLMQRLVVYAATNTVPPRNITVGQPLVALLAARTAGESLTFTDAAGHTHDVTAETDGGLARAVFPNATRPGPWTLTNPHGSGPIRFAVQSDRTESDLRLLSKGELGTIADKLGATLVQSRADLESFERASRFGTEIWRPFLILAVILLFADVFLAQRFVRAGSQS